MIEQDKRWCSAFLTASCNNSKQVTYVQVFSELDQKLQQAFTDYLEERGVNGELGRFVMDFSEDKEQREYMHWLQGVQKFLKQ